MLPSPLRETRRDWIMSSIFARRSIGIRVARSGSQNFAERSLYVVVFSRSAGFAPNTVLIEMPSVGAILGRSADGRRISL